MHDSLLPSDVLPRSSAEGAPVPMVYVFPEDVCPYAIIVTL